MVVPGGGVVSYERGIPVLFTILKGRARTVLLTESARWFQHTYQRNGANPRAPNKKNCEARECF